MAHTVGLLRAGARRAVVVGAPEILWQVAGCPNLNVASSCKSITCGDGGSLPTPSPGFVSKMQFFETVAKKTGDFGLRSRLVE